MPRPDKLGDLLARVRVAVAEGRFRTSFHARLRQSQRSITLPAILFVLNNGRHEKSQDKFDDAFQTWNYAIRGLSNSQEDTRVIVSFDEESALVVITAFYVGVDG